MALALFHVDSDPRFGRFIVWMAIGAALIAALVAADYFGGIPIP